MWKKNLNKFELDGCKPVITPLTIGCKLRKDDESLEVDQKKYKPMVGGLLYLTASRPNIMQVVFLVARFEANPKVIVEQAMKRVFGYLKGTVDFRLWYKKGGDFMLKAYIDADWAGSVDDWKSTSGGAFFLGDKLVS